MQFLLVLGLFGDFGNSVQELLASVFLDSELLLDHAYFAGCVGI